VNSGKQEGGGREKNQTIGEFSFRGILQPTTPVSIFFSFSGVLFLDLAAGRGFVAGLTIGG